jgi:predicted component of type VI protein secretion system
MNQEIKEALLSFRRRELWALEDELRRAESARLDAELVAQLAANAAQAEREKIFADTWNAGFKAGFEAAWKLPR